MMQKHTGEQHCSPIFLLKSSIYAASIPHQGRARKKMLDTAGQDCYDIGALQRQQVAFSGNPAEDASGFDDYLSVSGALPRKFFLGVLLFPVEVKHTNAERKSSQ